MIIIFWILVVSHDRQKKYTIENKQAFVGRQQFLNQKSCNLLAILGLDLVRIYNSIENFLFVLYKSM